MKQKLSAVALYFLIMLVLYGRKEIYPKTLYKAWEAGFKTAKRDPAAQPTYAANLTSELGKVGGSMDLLDKKMKAEIQSQTGKSY